MSQPEFNVEVATLDQHGDPGFVHYRGAFYTSGSAGAFALTQAAALSDMRDVDTVSVVIDSVTEQATRRDVEFIGRPSELAAELSTLPDYAPGVRRVNMPAPEQVTSAAERIAALTPSLPEADADSPGVLAVEVYSTRPDPIPNSRTDIGLYDDRDAYRIAEELAQELAGDIALTWGDSVLRVTHAAEISDTDRVVAERANQVQTLRANISVLDPVADAEHITALAADIDELRARSAPATRTDASAASAPERATSTSHELDVDRAQMRPRGLVSPPSGRSLGTGAAASTSRHTAPAPAHTSATSLSADHGLG